jgi:hypothetical protein
MKLVKHDLPIIVLVVSLIFGFAAASCSDGNDDTSGDNGGPKNPPAVTLDFNASGYTEKEIAVNGTTIKYREWANVQYALTPADASSVTQQSMNIYIPESAWNSRTAPIFFKNTVSGYMQSNPGTLNASDATGRALKEGFVVVCPGARGRMQAFGRAPAAIVDLKAAVRYLKYNDAVMPGDASKIISDGTSAGGGLSCLLGASGNSALYQSYLDEIGAADGDDGIFAVVAFCPITNLENSDSGYEWLYSRINDNRMAGGSSPFGGISTTPLSAAQKETSTELVALFPSYLETLDFTLDGGTALTSANLEEQVVQLLIDSANHALENGTATVVAVSAIAGITVAGGAVTAIDLTAFLGYVAGKSTPKSPPAFDSLGVNGASESGENNLFGTETVDNRNFTDFGLSKANGVMSTIDQAMKDRVLMMNPMPFLSGAKESDGARHWYIRHGSIDRDTSFQMQLLLALQAEDAGCDVNFRLAWEKGHTGDYDLEELFGWINSLIQ